MGQCGPTPEHYIYLLRSRINIWRKKSKRQQSETRENKLTIIFYSQWQFSVRINKCRYSNTETGGFQSHRRTMVRRGRWDLLFCILSGRFWNSEWVRFFNINRMHRVHNNNLVICGFSTETSLQCEWHSTGPKHLLIFCRDLIRVATRFTSW